MTDLTAKCRLCADLKHYNLLVDLQEDEALRIRIVEKLSRLSLCISNINSANDVLPKTVCHMCIDLLDKAFNFVLNVEKAQDILSRHVSGQNIEKEAAKVEVDLRSTACSVIDSKKFNMYFKSNPDFNIKLKRLENKLNLEENELEKCCKVSVSDSRVEMKSEINSNTTEVDRKINGKINDSLKIKQDISLVKDYPNVNAANNDPDNNLNKERISFNNWYRSKFKSLEIICKIEDFNTPHEVKGGLSLKRGLEIEPIESSQVNKADNLNRNDIDFERDKNASSGVNEVKAIKTSEDNRSQKDIKSENCKTKTHKRKGKECWSMKIPSEDLNLSWKDYRWKCVLCQTMFPIVDELIAHSTKNHGRCNAYQCIDCTSKCCNLDRFIKHIINHRQYLRLSCFKCHMIFPHPKDVHPHYKNHLKSNYKCSGCHETFQTSEELAKHTAIFKAEYHSPLSEDLEKLKDGLSCRRCQKIYQSKYELHRHIHRIHSEKRRQFSCETCGKFFLDKQCFDDHITTHYDNSKTFQCTLCKKYFRNNKLLQQHARIHNDSKPFSCDQCGKHFRLRKHLREHLNTHSDLRPWQCSSCNKTYKSKSNMKFHERLHSSETINIPVL